MKPLVKHFSILSKSNGLKLACPEIYEKENNIFKHTFRNGEKAVVIRCDKKAFEAFGINDYHPEIPNFQRRKGENDQLVIQYNDEFKGFVAVFIVGFYDD